MLVARTAPGCQSRLGITQSHNVMTLPFFTEKLGNVLQSVDCFRSKHTTNLDDKRNKVRRCSSLFF